MAAADKQIRSESAARGNRGVACAPRSKSARRCAPAAAMTTCRQLAKRETAAPAQLTGRNYRQ